MSLILDALQRSEQEQLSDGSPDLSTRHLSVQAESSPWLPRILMLLMVLLVGGLGWYLGTRQKGSEPAVDTPVLHTPAVEVQAPAIPEAVDAVEAVQPVVVAEPSIPPSQDKAQTQVADLYRQVQSTAPETAAGSGTLLPQVPPEQADAEPRAEPIVANPALDVDILTTAVQEQLEVAALDEHPAPWLSELAQNRKDRIPTIFYRKHEWSSSVEQSRVFLNKGSFTEGDQVAPGLRLVEILPQSIVLEYEGQAFRLRAMNSWVNL